MLYDLRDSLITRDLRVRRDSTRRKSSPEASEIQSLGGAETFPLTVTVTFLLHVNLKAWSTHA